MGCGGSKDGAQAPVSTLRRRLSIGAEVPKGANDELGGEEAREEARGMLAELNGLQLVDFVASSDNTQYGGRRWSIGSKTDADMNKRRSFDNKTVEHSGDSLDLNKLGIGFTCKKGLKPESPNQDSWFLMSVEQDFAVYGVFDGHGIKGHDVSNFVKDLLPKILLRDLELFKTDTAQALTKAFVKVQAMLEIATQTRKLDARLSGTTASVAVHHYSSKKLWVAHTGDSRVVIGRQQNGRVVAVPLTVDHKPDLPEERQRIEANGGMVIFDGFANFRVYATGASYPGLNMSRALGDLMGHWDAGISAVPAVLELNLTAEDEVLLLCSDGVWEFVSDQEAVDTAVALGPKACVQVAEKLARESWDRWIREEGGVVVDDITAIVAFLAFNQNSGDPQEADAAQ